MIPGDFFYCGVIMKSIKPGRGPSKMNMVGGIFAALFGIFWCIIAASIGAWLMVPFGLIFVGFAICTVIYNRHNVTSENRYSLFDNVDENEEKDPLNEKYGRRTTRADSTKTPGTDVAFCPYCGFSVNAGFEFCPKCGKKLPE